MEIKKFEVGPLAENTYLLMKQNEALLIDPGFSDETEYQQFKNSLNTGLIAVVLTHAHVDHVLGLTRVLKDYDIPVYLNTDDLFMWKNISSQAQMFGLSAGDFSFIPNHLPADKIVTINSFSFQSLYTPGHSPDHSSLYFKSEQKLFAGDALFRESVGRTDIYKGDFDLLEKSIRQKLYVLPDETVVYPGHGPETTIGHEKNHNAFVRAL